MSLLFICRELFEYIRVLSFVQGVDNIYTQHEPYITGVLLDQLIKGKLRDTHWPALCPIPSVEPRYKKRFSEINMSLHTVESLLSILFTNRNAHFVSIN